jgi:putative phosphoesterase
VKQVGVISDTHGVLPRAAVEALKGVNTIIHAGDIGDMSILSSLAQLAPVVAVRGNTDGGSRILRLPVTELTVIGGYLFYILHDNNMLDIDPPAAGIHIVISGHTHQPTVQWVNGILYFNPGSASRSRHGGPLSVGRLGLSPTGPVPEIISLDSQTAFSGC